MYFLYSRDPVIREGEGLLLNPGSTRIPMSTVDKIIEAKPDVVLHAGDLFDTVKQKTRAFTTVFEALEQLHAGDRDQGALCPTKRGSPPITTRSQDRSFNMSDYNPTQLPKHVWL